MKKCKDNYLTHEKESTKTQSNLGCYLAFNREYTVAEYLTTVTDPNLRKYRLSEHGLAIERGRHRQTWLSREDRLCAYCPQNEVETKLLLLSHPDLFHLSCDCLHPLQVSLIIPGVYIPVFPVSLCQFVLNIFQVNQRFSRTPVSILFC